MATLLLPTPLLLLLLFSGICLSLSSARKYKCCIGLSRGRADTGWQEALGTPLGSPCRPAAAAT